MRRYSRENATVMQTLLPIWVNQDYATALTSNPPHVLREDGSQAGAMAAKLAKGMK